MPFSSSLFTSLTNRVFRIQSKILLMNSKMKGMGSRVQIPQMKKARHISTPRRVAASMPPRSSRMGSTEIRAMTNSAGMDLRDSVNACTMASIQASSSVSVLESARNRAVS